MHKENCDAVISVCDDGDAYMLNVCMPLTVQLLQKRQLLPPWTVCTVKCTHYCLLVNYSASLPDKAFSTTSDFSWSRAKPSTTAARMDLRVEVLQWLRRSHRSEVSPLVHSIPASHRTLLTLSKYYGISYISYKRLNSYISLTHKGSTKDESTDDKASTTSIKNIKGKPPKLSDKQ